MPSASAPVDEETGCSAISGVFDSIVISNLRHTSSMSSDCIIQSMLQSMATQDMYAFCQPCCIPWLSRTDESGLRRPIAVPPLGLPRHRLFLFSHRAAPSSASTAHSGDSAIAAVQTLDTYFSVQNLATYATFAAPHRGVFGRSGTDFDTNVHEPCPPTSPSAGAAAVLAGQRCSVDVCWLIPPGRLCGRLPTFRRGKTAASSIGPARLLTCAVPVCDLRTCGRGSR